MTDAQTYYDGLLQQGYPIDQALGYTQQYFPGFVPVATTAMPMPAPQPVQPIIQQPVQQISQPMIMNNTPMATSPIGEPKPIMTWAAVGCIAVALLLTIMGQFGNSWQVSSEDDSISLGLRNIVIDCSKQQNEQNCISSSYVLLAGNLDKAAEETPPSDPLIKGKIENYCENTYKLELNMATVENNDTLRIEAGENREICLKNDSAGGITGAIIWIGIIGGLAATVMLVMSMLGQTLPGGAENYGKITSWVSGGLIILGIFLWLIMKDNLDGNISTGISFYLALFAGLFAVGAGILDMLDKREN